MLFVDSQFSILPLYEYQLIRRLQFGGKTAVKVVGVWIVMPSLLLAHICMSIFTDIIQASRAQYPFRAIFQLFADRVTYQKCDFASFIFLTNYFRLTLVYMYEKSIKRWLGEFIFEFHRFISIESDPKKVVFRL